MPDERSCIEKDSALGNLFRALLVAKLDDDTAVPLLATDNGDGTYTLKVDSELTAVGISTGTKTCATSAGRLKAATLENVVSLTVKVRSLGDASYVGVGNASGQDFRLTAIDDSIELDIDPYAVYVIDDHTSTAAVVEYIARLSA